MRINSSGKLVSRLTALIVFWHVGNYLGYRCLHDFLLIVCYCIAITLSWSLNPSLQFCNVYLLDHLTSKDLQTEKIYEANIRR